MRYAKVINFGKGFITHADQLVNYFSGKAGDIWEIDGDAATALAWITRVGGVEKNATQAATESNEVLRFIYNRLEFLRDTLTRLELNGIMDASETDATVRNILKYIVDSDDIDSKSTEYANGLAYLLSQGLLTQSRHDILLLGK